MSQYYILDCIEPFDWDDSALLEGIPAPKGALSWSVGIRFPTPPPEPVEINMLPSHNDHLLPFYDVDAIVMERRLAIAIREFGVDNLDVYSAVIRHLGTGREVTDYVAVNLIGLVAAVDLGRSRIVGGSSDRRIDTDFEGIEIDSKKALGLSMFRLAENTSAIVVSARLKEHLQSSGFDLLRFTLPGKYVG